LLLSWLTIILWVWKCDGLNSFGSRYPGFHVLKIRAKGGMPVAFADFEVLMLPVKEIACAFGLWPFQKKKKNR